MKVTNKLFSPLDMIKEDQDDYKKLAEEAEKSQEENTSGEYIYWVKGTPGNC